MAQIYITFIKSWKLFSGILFFLKGIYIYNEGKWTNKFGIFYSWNKFIQNYLIIQQTCAEAEAVVYYGEYYYSFVFLVKSMAYDTQ